MKDPLGVSPNKGNQGTTRGNEKIIFTSMGVNSPFHHCVLSATRHDIHMYPYFLLAAIPSFIPMTCMATHLEIRSRFIAHLFIYEISTVYLPCIYDISTLYPR